MYVSEIVKTSLEEAGYQIFDWGNPCCGRKQKTDVQSGI